MGPSSAQALVGSLSQPPAASFCRHRLARPGNSVGQDRTQVLDHLCRCPAWPTSGPRLAGHRSAGCGAQSQGSVLALPGLLDFPCRTQAPSPVLFSFLERERGANSCMLNLQGMQAKLSEAREKLCFPKEVLFPSLRRRVRLMKASWEITLRPLLCLLCSSRTWVKIPRVRNKSDTRSLFRQQV